jgi:signal transduction histidine kinase
LPSGSFLGVSVTIGASARGALYLTDKEGGFDSEDEALARLLVANAGRTITSAELYAESQAQQEQLTAQNERLRELDRMKDEFIALVSHELRTPLTIIGYLELLDDPDLNEEQRTFTVIMHRNATRLLRLVGDLLFLAGLQAGQLKIEPGEADLAELAGHALETARPAAERKHIALAFSAGPVPAVPCDSGRIAQLLDNLLSNAVKFTPEGGHVTVSLGTEGHCALLSVADDGMGIPADEQARVFERFFRTNLATSRAVQGTGLGLAICEAIVDSHSGTISVESQPSRGTTFRVRLPLRSSQDGDRTGPASELIQVLPGEPAPLPGAGYSRPPHGAIVVAGRVRLVADGGGLENRYGVQASSWVRIPHPPPSLLKCSLTWTNAETYRAAGICAPYVAVPPLTCGLVSSHGDPGPWLTEKRDVTFSFWCNSQRRPAARRPSAGPWPAFASGRHTHSCASGPARSTGSRRNSSGLGREAS